MRKGVLVIEPMTKAPRDGDDFYDRQQDMMMSWVPGFIPTKALKDIPARFCQIYVEDETTGGRFTFMFGRQAKYIYNYIIKNEVEKKPFFFFAQDDHVAKIQKAVLFSKDVDTMSRMELMAPIANEYGNYVAQQKAAGEGAVEFTKWYFEISI